MICCAFALVRCLANFLLFTSYADGQFALPPFYVKLTENVKSNNVAAITQHMVKTVVPSSQKSSAYPSRLASLSSWLAILAHLMTMAFAGAVAIALGPAAWPGLGL